MDDELWAVIEPLLPVRAPGTPGPARMDDRLVLQGILFVLFTGIGWEDLPQELGFGSGMTCWRRGAGLASGRGVRGDAPGDARPRQQRRVDRFRPGHRRRLARAGEKDIPGG
ncbi:transposase [Nocardia asteroides]|nr:transposase [Nocardia asteroides]